MSPVFCSWCVVVFSALDSQASGMFSTLFFLFFSPSSCCLYCIPHKYIAYIEFIACILIFCSYPPCIPGGGAFRGELSVL